MINSVLMFVWRPSPREAIPMTVACLLPVLVTGPALWWLIRRRPRFVSIRRETQWQIAIALVVLAAAVLTFDLVLLHDY